MSEQDYITVRVRWSSQTHQARIAKVLKVDEVQVQLWREQECTPSQVGIYRAWSTPTEKKP